jgi:hypothetical protein
LILFFFNINLPIEIINKILILRPVHPLAKIIKKLNILLNGPIIHLYDFEYGVLQNNSRKIPIVLMTYCNNLFNLV